MKVKFGELFRYDRIVSGGLGNSKVRIYEIKNPGREDTVELPEHSVKFRTFEIDEPGITVKPYLFVEKYFDVDLITVDIIYGDLNMQELINNPQEAKRLMNNVLTRENIELFTRQWCGLLPERIETDPYGKMIPLYNRTKVQALARKIWDSAFQVSRETAKTSSIKTSSKDKKKSIFFGEPYSSTNKGNSIFDKIFGPPKSKTDQQTQSQSQTHTDVSGLVQGNNFSSTIKEGVIFYRTGIVFLNDNKYLKFNYVTKDSLSDTRTKTNSFLISDFDEDKLRTDTRYRYEFVNEVLTPDRLESAREVDMFPYIGVFTPLGFDNDIDSWSAFHDLAEMAKGRGRD